MNAVSNMGGTSSELEIFIPENSPCRNVEKKNNNLLHKFKKKLQHTESKEKEISTKLQEFKRPKRLSPFTLVDIRWSNFEFYGLVHSNGNNGYKPKGYRN